MLAMLFWSIAALQQVTFHAFETGTNENRFAIGISSHMISATKAIWIPLRLYGFYSHERHALIPISPVFISRGSNLGSHVARYSIPNRSRGTELRNLCRSTPLGAAVGIAETGPFASHYWRIRWVIQRYRINRRK